MVDTCQDNEHLLVSVIGLFNYVFTNLNGHFGAFRKIIIFYCCKLVIKKPHVDDLSAKC